MNKKKVKEVKEEIKKRIDRIDTKVESYKKKYYIKMPEEKRSDIINQLIEIGKYIFKLELISDINLDIFPKIDCSNDFIKIKEMLYKIADLLNSCYNKEVRDEIKRFLYKYEKMIEDIEHNSKSYIIEIMKYFDSFEVSYGLSDYIKKQEGYQYVVDLLDSIDDISENIYRSRAMEYVQLIGINIMLEHFEQNLVVIENITCDNLRNALLDYIDDSICFSDFKKLNNI